MKKIVLGSDHGAVELKEELCKRLEEAGYPCSTVGATSSATAVDYPDVAKEAATLLKTGAVDCGILLCGTGLGIGISANKIKGIRAATCSDTFSARMAKEHNDANILCLGARVLGTELAWEIVLAYLQAEFQGGRHQGRVDKIMALED